MREINLSLGMIALIDDEDYERVSKYKWSAFISKDKKRYAFRTTSKAKEGKKTTMYLHRFILNAPQGLMVDHKDANTLDCRKSNLRLADDCQNQWNRLRKQNKTGFKGVRRNGKNGFSSIIRCRGKEIYLGTFRSKELAADAYDRKAIELFGEYARTNAQGG